METNNPAIKNFRGVYLPAHEIHLCDWFNKTNFMVDGKPAYQWKKIVAAMDHVPSTGFGACIDIGAHCGLWSMHLAKRFATVHAFEPVELHRQVFKLNVPMTNVRLYPMALGDRAGECSMRTTDGSSGDTWCEPNGEGVPMQRLDDVFADYVGARIGFVKIDCEGFELFVLRGGEALIRKHLPTIIVEQKPNRAVNFGVNERDAIPFLQNMGYIMQSEISGDFILTHPGAADVPNFFGSGSSESDPQVQVDPASGVVTEATITTNNDSQVTSNS